MNKSVRQNYLNEDEDALVVAPTDVDGGHGLPLDGRVVAHQFQNGFKVVKSQCGDCYIK